MKNRRILNELVIGNQIRIEEFIGNRNLFVQISTEGKLNITEIITVKK